MFSLRKKQSVNCRDALLNLSKKQLTLKERNAIRIGLNHPILPKKIDKNKLKVNIKKLSYALQNNTDFISVNDETRDKIKILVKQFVDAGNQTCSTRTNCSLHHTLNKLS